MLVHVVHTFGSSVYLIFILLFLWVCRIPRGNPGAGYWAVALLFTLLARASIPIMEPYGHEWLQQSVYSSLNIIGKPFLVLGVIRFTGSNASVRWVWALAILLEVLLALSFLREFSVWWFRGVFSVYGFVCFSTIALVAYRGRHVLPNPIMLLVAVISSVFALHWLSAYWIMYLFEPWWVWGYFVGTILNIALYLTLLSGTLLSIQKRLLDAEEKALGLAYHDPLTGLKNKRYMNNLFEHAVVLANRPHQLMAVLYIDLDNFKPINDSEGHKIGDEVLKIIAQRLQDVTRSTDICARVGGDEFVLIGTQLETQSHAKDIAEKVLLSVIEPIVINGKTYELGASIGVSVYPLHGSELADLVDKADQAMYQVKSGGKRGIYICQG